MHLQLQNDSINIVHIEAISKDKTKYCSVDKESDYMFNLNDTEKLILTVIKDS